MKIKVGNYILRSDRLAMWIDKEYVVEKGKHKGEVEVRRVAGYSTTFKSLLSSLTRNEVLGNDAESLEELLVALGQIMDDIEEVNRVAFERDFKLVKAKTKKEGCGKAE